MLFVTITISFLGTHLCETTLLKQVMKLGYDVCNAG